MKVINQRISLGDIDYAYGTTHQQYLIEYKEKLIKHLKPLNLGYFSHDKFHAWVDHPLIGIEGHEMRDRCQYTCMFLGKMYGFMPKYIFSDNIEKYFDHYEYGPWFKDMALDVDWTMSGVGGSEEEFWEKLNSYHVKPDHFNDLLLGSGIS